MNMKFVGAVSAFALMSGVAWAQSPTTPNATTPDSTVQQPAAPHASPDATTGASDQTLRSDDAVPPASPEAGTTTGQMSAPTEADAGIGVASVDSLMGKNVLDRNGEKLGDVEDVILGADGQAQKVVLSRGGFLGLGEKQIAIDFDQIQIRPDDNNLHVSGLTQDDAANMPEFEYDDSMTSLTRSRTDAPASPIAPAAPTGTGTTVE